MSFLSGSRGDMPLGAWLVPFGLMLLVWAAVNALEARGKDAHEYYPLATLHGVVTEVYTINPSSSASGSRVALSLDTLPGAQQVLMNGPHLDEADQRLRALPVGARITVDYDGFTQSVWALKRTDGGPGFGPSEIAGWLAEAHENEARRSKWYLAVGLLAVVAGIIIVARDSS
jgi:hypothetical protein